MGAIFNVGIFMSPVQEMKDRRGNVFFTGVSRRKRDVNTYDLFN